MGWYLAVIKKYAVFSGRASRREYWMFILFNTLVHTVLGIVDFLLGVGWLFNVPILPFVYGLAVLLPGLAVVVRRLHDTGRSGLWLLWCLPGLGIMWILRALYDIDRTVSPGWGLIPVALAFLVIFRFTLMRGTPEKNIYGPVPKA